MSSVSSLDKNSNKENNFEIKNENGTDDISKKIKFREWSNVEQELFSNLEKHNLEIETRVKDYSLLNDEKHLHPDLGSAECTDTLYSNIVGDAVIAGTSMEGHSIDHTSSFVAKFLEFLQTNKDLPEDMQEIFTQLQEDYKQIAYWQNKIYQVASNRNDTEKLKRLADAIAKEVSSLGRKEKKNHFALPGGWSGKPGHAMLYHFSTDDEGKTYTIAIYNTGGGIASYHDLLQRNNKVISRPIVRYEKVPREKLFFSKENKENKQIRSIFFQKLIECRIVPMWNPNREVKAKEIYEEAFSHLGDYRAVVDSNMIDYGSDYQTDQRSGTCSFKVLLPYLYYNLKPESRLKQFKWFKHQLALYSTLSYYRAKQKILGDDSPKASRARHLLKIGAKDILRRVARLNQLGKNQQFFFLEKGEIRTAYATAKELLAEIKEHEKKISKNQQKNVKAIDFSELKEIESYIKNNIVYLQNEFVEPYERSCAISTAPWLELSEIPEPKDLLVRIEKEIDALKNSSEKRFQIERFLELLPTPSKEKKDDYWQLIPKEDLMPSLEKISFFMEEYAKEVLHPFPDTPEQINVLLTAYAVTTTLAKRIDAEREREYGEPNISDYGIFFPLDILEEDPFTTYYSPSAHKRRTELVGYFKAEKKEKGELFNFASLGSIDDDSIKKIPECRYYNELLETNKELKNNIKNSKFWNTTEDERKKAFLMPKTFDVAELVVDIKLTKEDWRAGGFLAESKLKHIAILKRASLLAQMGIGFSGSGYFNKELSSRFYHSKESRSIRTGFYYKDSSYQSFKRGSLDRPYPCEKMHRKMDLQLKNYFKSFSGNKRFFLSNENLPLEGQALIEEFSKESYSKESSLVTPFNHAARDTSEPKLQPYDVLHHFRQYEKQRLRNPDLQTSFEILFFKSFVFEKDSEAYAST